MKNDKNSIETMWCREIKPKNVMEELQYLEENDIFAKSISLFDVSWIKRALTGRITEVTVWVIQNMNDMMKNESFPKEGWEMVRNILVKEKKGVAIVSAWKEKGRWEFDRVRDMEHCPSGRAGGPHSH